METDSPIYQANYGKHDIQIVIKLNIYNVSVNLRKITQNMLNARNVLGIFKLVNSVYFRHFLHKIAYAIIRFGEINFQSVAIFCSCKKKTATASRDAFGAQTRYTICRRKHCKL